ncbi:MAG: hypothetical protein KJ698_06325 [Actinobacteria bacterium]|nr:hypothetical protein [Actinomycetota bacterium]
MSDLRQLAMEAMGLALDRAEHARTQGEMHALFAPLAEALWWSAVLDDSFWKSDCARYSALRKHEGHVDLMVGLRYARNRLTHDIDITGMHGLMEGATFPLTFPLRFRGWRWRCINDLPSAGRKDEEREKAYKAALEGRDVEETLRDAADFLRGYLDRVGSGGA